MEKLYWEMVSPRAKSSPLLSFSQSYRNRGELAEGWYDPATLDKARKTAAEQPSVPYNRPESPDYTVGGQAQGKDESAQPMSEDEDDDYGPSLPQPGYTKDMAHSGPTMPNMQDIELKRGIVPYISLLAI